MDVEINRYTKIVLYVIDGDEGLSSVDPFSLEILLNLKLNNCSRVEVRKARMNPNADLPKLVVNNVTYYHPEQIRKVIEKLTGNKINQKYSKIELSRLNAHFAQVERFVATATLLHCWAIDENAILTMANYSKGMWFPFGALYTRNQRKKFGESINLMVGEDDLKTFIDQKFIEFDNYLKDLSNMLGNKKYIMGNHPTTLDLYLCSLLAPVMRFNYTNNQLLTVINGNMTISDYIRNFLTRYLPHKDSSSNEVPVENDRAPTLMLIAATFSAVAAMGLFAWSHGIIHK